MKYAFRCKNCRRLVEGGAAGENEVPRACPSCGRGVRWELSDAGVPQIFEEPENWIVLADLGPNELKPILSYHGIEAGDVERHKPFAPGTHQPAK